MSIPNGRSDDDANLVLHIRALSRNHLRRSIETSVSVKEYPGGTLTLHLLTNSRAFSTFTPDQSFNSAHITNAQYVNRKSTSPPVGSEVKLYARSARRTLIAQRTNLPSSRWLDLRNVTRPSRSRRVKSSRKTARVMRAVYVTIICGASNSDSYTL